MGDVSKLHVVSASKCKNKIIMNWWNLVPRGLPVVGNRALLYHRCVCVCGRGRAMLFAFRAVVSGQRLTFSRQF